MLDILTAVLVTGLTNGALYALATVGLSLIWGSMGMLNMAHGAMLALGGYIAFTVVETLGLPLPVAMLAAVAAGALAGILLYLGIVRSLLKSGGTGFETSVMIATVGIAIALQNALLLVYGGQPLRQPFAISGAVSVGAGVVPMLNIVIVAVAVAVMVAVSVLISRTRMGRAIRATAQNRDAALLMGVPVGRVYLQVLALSGGLAGICGVLVSSITQLTPGLGADPMLKAFIMCVVAGLGNLPGAIAAAFGLAIIEAAVQFGAGARWGFPVLLLLVIAILIWRPAGLFGRAQIRRM
ncbi:branched-chain amino acid ABC transporter permease [Paroceanicella profunda]|uniref:Branched-chain amino acid ABC transporter permease n=1 Tax=Paroceanicella profunda TaxID=2579971 RepID=A0A5B8FWS8_9RHOB|nr:branched-chain amino acid ABC transporter permease [Paroceanicella profunda]QDL93346.1 branched-chain amino acid ABC transporter permease [Paroceanicella profunda]